MVAKESLQKKLDRVRPPRVQIRYEVYVGNAMEMKELPFVMGVLGDFSGKPDPNKKAVPLKDRKFINIDRDSFDGVMASKDMAPRLAYSVNDTLTGKADQQLNVELKFNKMEDFTPENVAKQIPALRALLEQREALKNLSSRLEGNDKLDDLLKQVLENSELRDSLAKELGTGPTEPPQA
ncbi:type VI secretion system contractile sheath small subunit [Schlesneria paludicola]|uniref:type VI secretion system contractile sheath small subunit n=1 Tax=Schlesneria paludicola TaxID=360056 RepID=UPI0012F7FD22